MAAYDILLVSIDIEISKADRSYDSGDLKSLDCVVAPVEGKRGAVCQPAIWTDGPNYILGYTVRNAEDDVYAVMFKRYPIAVDEPGSDRVIALAAKLTRAAAPYEHLHDSPLYRSPSDSSKPT